MSLMMMKTNPITPPQELVDQWCEEWHHSKVSDTVDLDKHIANQAAQWGYQQAVEELETFLRKSNDAH